MNVRTKYVENREIRSCTSYAQSLDQDGDVPAGLDSFIPYMNISFLFHLVASLLLQSLKIKTIVIFKKISTKSQSKVGLINNKQVNIRLFEMKLCMFYRALLTYDLHEEIKR